MEQVEGIQRRQYYRLKYPKEARPLIRIEDQFFRVSESSERGLRVRMSERGHLRRGSPFSGTIRLHNNQEVDIEGVVIRFSGGEVIVKLDKDKGLSFKDMVSEQRYIRQRYPLFK